MVSVRPGRLLAAGFGVAPSTTRYVSEQPPLASALRQASALVATTIKEANRFLSSSSSLPLASKTPAIAALTLGVLSMISIGAGLPASLAFCLASAAAASALVAWSRSKSGANNAHLSVPPSLGMSSTSSSLLAGSPARKKAGLLSAAAAVSSSSSHSSLSSTPTKAGSGSSGNSSGIARMVTVVVDAGLSEITAAE